MATCNEICMTLSYYIEQALDTPMILKCQNEKLSNKFFYLQKNINMFTIKYPCSSKILRAYIFLKIESLLDRATSISRKYHNRST